MNWFAQAYTQSAMGEAKKWLKATGNAMIKRAEREGTPVDQLEAPVEMFHRDGLVVRPSSIRTVDNTSIK